MFFENLYVYLLLHSYQISFKIKKIINYVQLKHYYSKITNKMYEINYIA